MGGKKSLMREMGKAEEQQETLTEMGYGVFLALILIYIVLAWVFASYGWPLSDDCNSFGINRCYFWTLGAEV